MRGANGHHDVITTGAYQTPRPLRGILAHDTSAT